MKKVIINNNINNTNGENPDGDNRKFWLRILIPVLLASFLMGCGFLVRYHYFNDSIVTPPINIIQSPNPITPFQPSSPPNSGKPPVVVNKNCEIIKDLNKAIDYVDRKMLVLVDDDDKLMISAFRDKFSIYSQRPNICELGRNNNSEIISDIKYVTNRFK